MKRVRYTKEEDQYIAERYGKIRINAVAAALKRDVTSIYGRIHRIGIKRHNKIGNFITVHDRDEIKKLINRGKATRQIIKIISISENYLRKIVKEELPEKYFDKLMINGKKQRLNKKKQPRLKK